MRTGRPFKALRGTSRSLDRSAVLVRWDLLERVLAMPTLPSQPWLGSRRSTGRILPAKTVGKPGRRSHARRVGRRQVHPGCTESKTASVVAPLQTLDGRPNTHLRLQGCMGSAMSRAHAVAPMVGAEAPFRGPVSPARRHAPGPSRRLAHPSTTCYLERALLLWPRLDRAKIRKISNNPVRIAELVERRTSQPFDVILAMLTKHAPALTGPTDESSGFDVDRHRIAHVALRVVRGEEGSEIQFQDLPPA